MKITDTNKFLKILLDPKMGIAIELLKDNAYEWEISELAPHKFLVQGFHPVAKRLAFKNTELIFQ